MESNCNKRKVIDLSEEDEEASPAPPKKQLKLQNDLKRHLSLFMDKTHSKGLLLQYLATLDPCSLAEFSTWNDGRIKNRIVSHLDLKYKPAGGPENLAGYLKALKVDFNELKGKHDAFLKEKDRKKNEERIKKRDEFVAVIKRCIKYKIRLSVTHINIPMMPVPFDGEAFKTSGRYQIKFTAVDDEVITGVVNNSYVYIPHAPLFHVASSDTLGLYSLNTNSRHFLIFEFKVVDNKLAVYESRLPAFLALKHLLVPTKTVRDGVIVQDYEKLTDEIIKKIVTHIM